MFGKQIKSEATWNRLKREERTHLAREKLRLCQHSTMLHRANTLIFLSSTVHLDVTTWGNFLNYLHMTGVCLSELGGNAAWHHHSSSLPHTELVLCLSCHIFVLDVSVAQCWFWWEVTSLGLLWTQALLCSRCNCPWLPAPSEGSPQQESLMRSGAASFCTKEHSILSFPLFTSMKGDCPILGVKTCFGG